MTSSFRLLPIFLPFAAAYFLSYVLRTINAVLSAPLAQEFSLSASDLGLLSSAYFLTFAAMQIPLGSLLDRRGPKNISVILLVFAVVGCLVSAFSTGFLSLWLGRALIGVGVSACLMASYKAYRQCFPPSRQPSLASLMLMVGSFGALMATLPIELLMPLLGWRGIFFLAAVLFAFAGIAIYWLLPPLLPSAPPSTPFWTDTLGGARKVFANSEIQRFIPFAIFTHGGFLAIQGLWMGPWFRTVESLSAADAAGALLVLGIVVMLAHMIMSWMGTQFVAWKWTLDDVILYGCVAILILSLAAIFNLWQSSVLSWSIMFAATAITAISYAKVSLIFPVAMAGRASTSINFIVFVGAFGMQWGLGLLIDLFGLLNFSAQESLRGAFLFWVAAQAFALAWMWLKRPATDRVAA